MSLFQRRDRKEAFPRPARLMRSQAKHSLTVVPLIPSALVCAGTRGLANRRCNGQHLAGRSCGCWVVVGVACFGSGGAEVGSQGRKPLEREWRSHQAPAGRQNTRAGSKVRLAYHNRLGPADWRTEPLPRLWQSDGPPGLCCSDDTVVQGLAPLATDRRPFGTGGHDAQRDAGGALVAC